jgi:hypothetical protein
VIGHGLGRVGGECRRTASEQGLWGEDRLFDDQRAGGEREGVGSVQSGRVEVGLCDDALAQFCAEDTNGIGGAGRADLDADAGEDPLQGRGAIGVRSARLGTRGAWSKAVGLDGAQDVRESQGGAWRLRAQRRAKRREGSQQEDGACGTGGAGARPTEESMFDHVIN